MIIRCNNCAKQFEVDSGVIPEKGRLLQCNSCNHKWFFKKKIVHSTIETIKLNNPSENIKTFEEKTESIKTENTESIELLDKTIKEGNANKSPEISVKTNPSRVKKNYKILKSIVVFIISFIALIIILDTFQGLISKIVPNIEFLLYNLYESINDIGLFLKDLI